MSTLLRQLARDGDISWLSFYFAEFVAQQGEHPMDALTAFAAALVSEANLAGDVCIDLARLQGRPLFVASRIDASEIPAAPAPGEWRKALLSSRCVGEGGQVAPLIVEGSRLYLNRYWHYETRAAEIITAMLAHEPVTPTAIPAASVEPGMDPDQAAAVSAATRHRFSVISGGPGSGKTSTVVRILAQLLGDRPGCRIVLAAPTGKAAARMMDSIGQRLETLDIDATTRAAIPREARTLHRLLGYRHRAFDYNARHRLPVDCVVVDEASMIDLKLMYQLLIALPDSAQLILLGDRDQLASVAAGNVLGDITGHGYRADAGAAPAIASATRLLRSSYRFGSDSAIGLLAQQVRNGDAAAARATLQADNAELRWFESNPLSDSDAVDARALAWIFAAYQPIFECAGPGEAIEVYEATRLLCATNRGPLGVDALNRQVSSALLAQNQQPDSALFAGLPIMITRNLHELNLFNGDTGMLWQIDGELRACFRSGDGQIRDLAINRIADFKPAWASTVHKSQGSEFDSVLLLLPADAQSEALSRELLYTAITRARREFLLQAPEASLARAVSRITRRHSGLAAKLGWPAVDDYDGGQ